MRFSVTSGSPASSSRMRLARAASYSMAATWSPAGKETRLTPTTGDTVAHRARSAGPGTSWQRAAGCWRVATVVSVANYIAFDDA